MYLFIAWCAFTRAIKFFTGSYLYLNKKNKLEFKVRPLLPGIKVIIFLTMSYFVSAPIESLNFKSYHMKIPSSPFTFNWIWSRSVLSLCWLILSIYCIYIYSVLHYLSFLIWLIVCCSKIRIFAFPWICCRRGVLLLWYMTYVIYLCCFALHYLITC